MIVQAFYYDNEPLLLPGGTVKVHDSGNWGLYQNQVEGLSFLITRGKKNNRLGWRVRTLIGIVSINYATDFVKNSCGECLGL